MLTTENAHVQFGRYKGELLTRVPAGYLRWSIAQGIEAPQPLPDTRPVPMSVPFNEAAALELERRGERVQEVEISPEAVDRFTQHDALWAVYRQNRRHDLPGAAPEGLHGFLSRVVEDIARLDGGIGLAMLEHRNTGKGPGNIKVGYLGARWCIQVDLALPVLITVTPGEQG